MSEKTFNEDLVDQFGELKLLVETLQEDIVKSAGGNKSAGLRVRKGLREAKKLASDIVKLSLADSKGEL